MTRNDFSVFKNNVAIDINDKMVVFVVWDFESYDEKTKNDCLDQLATIMSLGGTFDDITRHMKLNGYDCDLADIYELS